MAASPAVFALVGTCAGGTGLRKMLRGGKQEKQQSGSFPAEGNSPSGIRENQGGGAVEQEEKQQQGIRVPAQSAGEGKPQFFAQPGQTADPDCPGNAKAQRRPQADITAEVQQMAAVVPIAQMPECIQKPANHKLQTRPEQGGQEEYGERTAFF